MDLAAVGPEEEEFLLELLNTTPVVDGEPRDDLAQPKVARAWMRAHGVASTNAELAALLDAGRHSRRWSAVTRLRRRFSASSNS